MTPRCSQEHRGRSLLGTAPEQSEWIFVDVPKPWPPKVEKLEAVEGLRRQLGERGKVVATVALDAPRIRVLQRRGVQTRYAEVGGGEEALRFLDSDQAAPCPELVLVCTHGSRDPCCGQFGPPVLQKLRDAGVDALECSHLGGHRFAPTVLAFPQFRCFGAVTPDRVPEFVHALRAGQPQPDFHRGATYLDKATQLGEGAVWTHTSREPSLTHLLSDHNGHLTVAVDRKVYRVEYLANTYQALASCGEGEPEEWQDVRILDVQALG